MRTIDAPVFGEHEPARGKGKGKGEFQMRGEFGGSANEIAEIYEYLRNLRKPSIRVRARRYIKHGVNPHDDEYGFGGYGGEFDPADAMAAGFGGGDLMDDPDAPAVNDVGALTSAPNSREAAGPRQAQYDLQMPPIIWKDGKPPMELPTLYKHHYNVDNVICANGDAITDEQMADALSRFALPRKRHPHAPVVSGREYSVHDPHTGLYGGQVTVTVFNNGLSVRNKTTEVHVFDGDITRTAYRRGKSWRVKTVGFGKIDLSRIDLLKFLNPRNLSHVPNQIFGPIIFDTMDKRMSSWLDRRCRSGSGRRR